jgi:hypothetical protein
MSADSKRKRVKLRQRDLFEFSVTNGQLAYGMVIIPGGVLYAAFFRGLHSSRPGIAVAVADEVALVGTTMDSEFYHGRWSVIAHDQPIPRAIPFPNWKVKIGEELRTTDFEGRNHWPMRPEEADLLDYKFSQSPLEYQDALEALNGLREWQVNYDKLTPAYAARRMTRA